MIKFNAKPLQNLKKTENVKPPNYFVAAILVPCTRKFEMDWSTALST